MENNDGLVQNSNAEPFDKEKWAKQKREERKVVYQMIDDAAVAAVSSGEKFQAFLNIQAQFDRYSASNALLLPISVRMQRSWQTLLPGRTLVFTSRKGLAPSTFWNPDRNIRIRTVRLRPLTR